MRDGQEWIVLAGESFEYVEEFCYLFRNMISAGAVVGASSCARVINDWKKLREVFPLLMLRDFLLELKGTFMQLV